MTTVLVLGATSTIAQETVRQLAAKKMDIILAGRREQEMDVLKSDLEIRYGVEVDCKYFDALDFERHEDFFTEVVKEHPSLDGVLLMYGVMNNQKEAERIFHSSRPMIDVNYTSAVSILNIAANYFEERQRGFIGA